MARYVIDGAYAAAATGDFSRAVRAHGGSKDAFWADVTPYESGSDHWIYQEGAFRVPTVYLRDWPDIYIHTNKDAVDNIEPTKIKRSAFIAAASGYYLAAMPGKPIEMLTSYVVVGAHARIAEETRRAVAMMPPGDRIGTRPAGTSDAMNTAAQALAREQRRLRSIVDLAGLADPQRKTRVEALAAQLGGIWESMGFPAADRAVADRDRRVPVRNAAVKGPLDAGGAWIVERAGAAAAKLKIHELANADDVTYEIVNFVDGTRNVGDIRDAVSAEFQPVEIRAVSEYLDLLATAGAITWKR